MTIQSTIMEGFAEAFIPYIVFICAFIFIAAITAITARKFKTRTLVWYFLFAFANAAFGTCELLVIITGNIFWRNFTYSTVTGGWFFCWMMFFNSSARTHTSPVLIAFILTFIAVLHVMTWLPSLEIEGTAVFLGSYLLPLLVSAMFIYWAAITFINSPWFARKAALLLFIASILLTISNLFITVLPKEISIIFIISFSSIIAGVIFKHPGIIAFLPYKAQYMVLLDKRGELVFDQSWMSKGGTIPLEVDRDRKNLVTLMKEMYKFDGGTLVGTKEVELEIGNAIYLINTGSKHFNAGLITKHSSKALREGFMLFMRHVDEIKDNVNEATGGSIQRHLLELTKTRMLNVHAFI